MPDPGRPSSYAIAIPCGKLALDGKLAVPVDARGLVVFAGRTSSLDTEVASALVVRDFATLQLDLLAPAEQAAERASHDLRFDIHLLADRLVSALGWIAAHGRLGALPLGLFGASTGAAAALVAATRRPAVAAIVSRSGRPDLAASALPRVTCPTLLVVGGADTEVLELNRRAMKYMTATTRLHIVPGGHLLDEPDALREVGEAAAGWFHTHLEAARWRDQHPELWPR
ncbi:MAG TPA: hypothetical protein VLX92_35315 [Kofleriaceae bacterium]|nr:hypothetical protein [Kofleriaceae bacterium]